MDTNELIANVLVHHGVKGMKWGVRRNRGGPPVTVATRDTGGKGVKATGGENHPAHPDAVRAIALGRMAKKSTTHSLSTKELQDLVNRMNLEQQYSRLATQSGQTNAGAKFAKDLLGNVAKQQVTRVANDSVAKMVAKSLAKNAVKVAAVAV